MELVDGGRDLQSVQKNALLTLKKDVFGPSYESSQVSGGLDAVSDSEVTRSLFEEGISFTCSFLLNLSTLSCLLFSLTIKGKILPSCKKIILIFKN